MTFNYLRVPGIPAVVSPKKQFLVYTAVRNVYTTSDALSTKLQIRGPETGLLLGIILSLLLMADSWRAILLIILADWANSCGVQAPERRRVVACAGESAPVLPLENPIYHISD